MKGRVSDLQAAVMSRRYVDDSAWRGERAGFGGVDLRAEMLRFGMDYRGCRRLEALGVKGRFVAELGAACAIGQAKVTLSRDGRRWEPVGPDARLLLAVVEAGQLVDIAAVSTSHPDEVTLRLGQGVFLGEERIEDAERAAMAERRFTLRLVADPIEWLKAWRPPSSSEAVGRNDAVCVLDWAGALARLRGLGERVTLECDAGAGARIKALLEVGGVPRVKERPPMARREAA